MLLLRSEFRVLTKHPFNTFFVTLSLGIAIASVSLTHYLSVSIVERFNEFSALSNFDYVVDLPSNQEDEYFEVVRRWQGGELSSVTHVVPVIEGSIEVQGQAVSLLGYDPVAASGQTETDLNQVSSFDPSFLTRNTVVAAGIDVEVGSTIRDAEVIALAESNTPYLLADIPTAQYLHQAPDRIDLVWLRVETNPTNWLNSVLPGVLTAAKVDKPVPLLEGYQVQPFDWWNPSRSLGDSIVFNIAMLSFLTLLVAGFIIVQMLQTNLASRQQQFRVLHTLGVTNQETRKMIFTQCLVYGLLGGILGTVLIFVGLYLFHSYSWTDTWRSLELIGYLKGVLLGFTTVLLAGALLSTYGRSYPKSLKATFGFVTLVILAWGLTEASGLLGASLISVCLCVIHVLWIAPSASFLLEKTLQGLKLRSLRTQMILRSSLNSTRQIRFAISALSIAIAAAMGIGMMLVSFRVEFLNLLDQRLSADLHVSNASNVSATELLALDDIDAVFAYRRGEGRVNGYPVKVIATDINLAEAQRYGLNQPITSSILINEVGSRRYQLSGSDLVEIQIGTQHLGSFPVERVFKDYGEVDARIIVPASLVPENLLVQDRFSIQTTKPSNVSQEIQLRYPEVQIVDNDNIRSIAIRVFNTSFASAQYMVNLAILVAALGIACALIGLQASRLRDMQVLSLLGNSRLSLVSKVLAHNLVVACLAVVAALPLGIALALNLCYLVNPRAYGWSFEFLWSFEALLLPTAIGVGAAVLAGLEPLRRLIRQLVNEPLPQTN